MRSKGPICRVKLTPPCAAITVARSAVPFCAVIFCRAVSSGADSGDISAAAGQESSIGGQSGPSAKKLKQKYCATILLRSGERAPLRPSLAFTTQWLIGYWHRLACPRWSALAVRRSSTPICPLSSTPCGSFPHSRRPACMKWPACGDTPVAPASFASVSVNCGRASCPRRIYA